MSTYYTDREYGARPPSVDTIDDRLWAGLYSLIQTRIGDGSFGLRFPEQCADGNDPCGCDEQAFHRVLTAEVPWVVSPLSATEMPKTPVILDLLEFCARAVGEPIQGAYHSFYRHHHLSWDRDSGLQRFVGDVNMLFRRNALAFELTPEGQARRLLPAPLPKWSAGLFSRPVTPRLIDSLSRRGSGFCRQRRTIAATLWKSSGMPSSVGRRSNRGPTNASRRMHSWIGLRR
ncbi:MAG: hypothetical protein IKE60_30695 [Reyranella sp.]|nr:hypothetical protein [Reyranella sp.]MBR2819075.1 hypothetical protein [Reyranella sp.]